MNVRITRVRSRLVGYRVASPLGKVILTGCTRTNRLTAVKGPLFGITSVRRVCVHTCVASRRLSRIGLKRGTAMFSSCNGSAQGRCPKIIA